MVLDDKGDGKRAPVPQAEGWGCGSSSAEMERGDSREGMCRQRREGRSIRHGLSRRSPFILARAGSQAVDVGSACVQ